MATVLKTLSERADKLGPRLLPGARVHTIFGNVCGVVSGTHRCNGTEIYVVVLDWLLANGIPALVRFRHICFAPVGEIYCVLLPHRRDIFRGMRCISPMLCLERGFHCS